MTLIKPDEISAIIKEKIQNYESQTEISNVGELYTVTVEYMPPTALAMEGIKLDNSAAKTMVYTLSKSRNSMTIHSAKNATSYGDAYEY